MARNADAEYGGDNVSRTDEYAKDESEWSSDQFVESAGGECIRSGCEDHTKREGDAFCLFCWGNLVLPETDMSPFTGQKDGLEEIDVNSILEQIKDR